MQRRRTCRIGGRLEEDKYGSTPLLLRAALAYAGRGVPVFPCEPGAKRPLTRNGHWDATTDRRAIERWWRRQPSANIGLPTGKKSGIVVLDVDALLNVPEVVIQDCENQGTKWKSNSLDRQWFLAAGLEEEEQGDDPRSFSGKELGRQLHVPGAEAAPTIDDRAGTRDYRQRTLCARLGFSPLLHRYRRRPRTHNA